MTQKDFAGFNLAEVLRKCDAETAAREAAAAKAARTAKRNPASTIPPAPTPEPTTPPLIVPYQKLDWEARAYREADQTNKASLHYDKSLERLQAAGFQRHPRPQEVFGLLIASLEGKLTDPAQQAIVQDMLSSYGEWLSLAVQREGDVLHTFLDPEGLVRETDKYVKTSGFRSSQERQFNIAGIPSKKYVDLKDVPDDLVRYLYTRSFAALPAEMREGNRRAQLYLPAEGILRPAGRGNDGSRLGVGGCYGGGASRGVREKNFP